MTLLTKDVFAFDMAVHFGEMIFAGTIEIVILTVLMYKEIGVASIYGCSLLFVLLPVQGKNLEGKLICIAVWWIIKQEERVEKRMIISHKHYEKIK